MSFDAPTEAVWPEGPALAPAVAELAAAPGGITEIGELPKQVNLAIYQGITFALKVTVMQEGGPADLTGMTPQAQIRRRPSDQQVMAEFAVGIEDNVIFLQLSDEQTAELSSRGGVWDVRVSYPGFAAVLVRGRVRVTERVTR